MLHDRLADVVGPRYALERELTGGGMARVFLARDPLLDRRVVIKVLPPERATAAGMARFHREARLLAKLNHPHIIPILDTGTSHELPWFAMPWIAGQTLADRIASAPLPAREVRAIGRELLDALGHAHRLGVIHRDIKPANIFLHAGHALLADFGVAAITDSTDSLTDAGVAVGTLAYMAPERRVGAASDARSDTWELAATLYEACTGVRWTEAGTTTDPWRGVPGELVTVLQRALAERPADRWSDTTAFGEAFRHRRLASPKLRWAVTGLVAVAAVLAWQWSPGREAGWDDLRGAGEVQFVPEPGSPPWVVEVARNAATTVRWLPGTPASSGSLRASRAPVRIQMRQAVDQDSVLMLEGYDADGNFTMRARVDRAQDDWSRAVVDTVIAKHFAERLIDFRLLVNSTDNVQALNAWYRGSEAFQAARWEDADHHYREALRHDPGFLAATWSLLLTDMWRRAPYQRALSDLLARRELLPPMIRGLVEAQVEPHLPTRIARFDSLVSAFPDFGPARMLHANELFHRGPLVGRSLRDGVDAFVRAARDIPGLDHRTTWQHVLWGAIRLGDEPRALEAWQRLQRWPGDPELTAFLGLALDARFSPLGATARRGLLHSLATDDRLTSMSRYLRLGADFDIPGEVRRMAQLVADRTEEPEVRASALATRATTYLMNGQVRAALRELDRAAAVNPSSIEFRLQAAEWKRMLPLFEMAVDPEEFAAAGNVLVEIAGRSGWWPRAVWVLAMTDSTPTATGWADSLSRGASHDGVAALLWPLYMAHRQATGPARALELSMGIQHDPGDSLVIARGPLARAVTYLARGRWQLLLGDSAAAEREWRWHENNDLQGWPSGPPQDGELDAAFSAPARLLRASILCGGADRAAGALLMGQADAAWRDADEELRDQWSVVRERIAACR